MLRSRVENDQRKKDRKRSDDPDHPCDLEGILQKIFLEGDRGIAVCLHKHIRVGKCDVLRRLIDGDRPRGEPGDQGHQAETAVDAEREAHADKRDRPQENGYPSRDPPELPDEQHKKPHE